MGSYDPLITELDGQAMIWSRQFARFSAHELISDHPWSRTYRLNGAKSTSYLKVVPKRQAHALNAISALTIDFAGLVPHVLGLDSNKGWLLTADVGGRSLNYDSANEDLVLMTQTYAALQAKATGSMARYKNLPRIDLSVLAEQLLEFLKPLGQVIGDDDPRVSAEYFIGREKALSYRQSLLRRLPLLQQHIACAAELPMTVNHGDLRPPNANIIVDGRCALLDWDDVSVGPAGMSIHGLFGGCSIPTVLLSGSPAAEAAATTPRAVLIKNYVATLAEEGYAELATIKRAIPGAMCAGMIHFVLHFARFPGEDTRDDVGETIESRLEDLLDVCDLLITRNSDITLEYAQDYEEHRHYTRAQALLNDYLRKRPGNLEAMKRLARVLHSDGDLEEASKTYRQCIKLSPDDAALRSGLGNVLIERLQLAPAKGALKKALELDSKSESARLGLQRVAALEQMLRMSARSKQIPKMMYSEAERVAGIVKPEMLALSSDLLEKYGTLQIDNVFDPARIAKLHEVFVKRYTAYFREDNHPDALYLGDKRYMLTMDIEEPFNDAALIAAPLLMPIIRKMLGDDFVLGAYTAVISLPGSKDQDLHKDHPALFPNTPWHHTLPCFAAQIIIPLVPLNAMTGTTRFYKGSHRIDTEKVEALGFQDPIVPVGSCLLNDYRCAHRGVGNRSQQVRPMLTLIFTRRWFHDYRNYDKQPPIRLSEQAYEQLPVGLKPLFDNWKERRKHDRLMRASLL